MPPVKPLGWPRLRQYQKDGAEALAERILGLGTCDPKCGVFAAAGLGKAIWDNEPVLTPSGWTPIGDLHVGDKVIDPDGGTVKVRGVYPQGEQDLFELKALDGGSVCCTRDHLWTVYAGTSSEPQTLTTAEVRKSLGGSSAFLPRPYYYPEAHSHRQIDSIEPAGRGPCTCISVSSKRGLFVTRDHIVTHNTALVLAGLWLSQAPWPWLFVTRAIGRHVWERDANWVLGPDYAPGELWAGKARGKGYHQNDDNYSSVGLVLSERLGVVTNYEVLGARADELLAVPWGALILDESHNVKGGYLPPQQNRDGTLHRNRYHHAKDLALGVHARGGPVIPVTATPIANRRNDLWAQLDMTLPGTVWSNPYDAQDALRRYNDKRRAQNPDLPWVGRRVLYKTPTGLYSAFGPYGPALIYGEIDHPTTRARSFLRRFCAAREGQYGGVDSTGMSNTEELEHKLSHHFIRITREEVADQLPAIQRDVHSISPTKEATLFLGGGYEEALARAAMVKEDEAIELAMSYVQNGEKALIATNRRKLAHRLFSLAEKAAHKLPKHIRDELWIECATGETSVAKRKKTLDEFNESTTPGLMLATTECLSESINLHYIPGVIVAGLPITPRLVGQFEGRFARLGGIPCTIHYLIAEGTIDERVRDTLLAKLSDVSETGAATSGEGGAHNDLAGCRNEEEIIADLRDWLKNK